VITSEEGAKSRAKVIKEAIDNNIPLIKEEFIADSIAAGKVEDPEKYSLQGDTATKSAPLQTSLKSIGTKVASKSAASKSVTSSVSGSIGKSGSGKAKVKVKGRGAVDPDSNLDETGHIYDDKKLVWTASMTSADIQTGRNSYYILQLIEMDTKNGNSLTHTCTQFDTITRAHTFRLADPLATC